MKILKVLLVIIGVLLITAAVYFYNLGFFSSLVPQEKVQGGFKVIGKEYTGDYAKAGKYVTDVQDRLKASNIVCTKGFGIYYDDPSVTPADKRRSFVGCIVEPDDWDKVESLEDAGFRLDSVPSAHSVVVEFPVKSAMSYIIGPMKAYPVMSKYMNEKGYAATTSLEIYDMPNQRIDYVMQVRINK